eukprot:Opistho-1_new@74083
MALNDDDVSKQIAHMVAFIQQEAKEKANEITVKAEEEFNIEKGRLVQQERLKIIAAYERKEKQVEVQKKIAYSNELNVARLQVLKARDEHLERILAEAGARLATITKQSDRYKKLLEGLLSQCVFQLLEDKAIVRCRRVDVPLVQSVIPTVQQQFQKSAGRSVQIVIDNENSLPEASAGGVEVVSSNGRVKIANTLETRLQLVAQQMLPEIRTMLFGKSLTRTFFD